MSTDAQVFANRNNALNSTGPRTEAGKARSRANATTHGLTGDHLPESLRLTDVYQLRYQELETQYQPDTPALRNALELAVGAFVQATTAFDMLSHEMAKRQNLARNGWETFREQDAIELMAKIGRNPMLVVANLRVSKAGCLLLIDHWTRLKNIAEKLGGWKEAHIEAAFNLLGVPRWARSDTSQLIAAEPDRVGLTQKQLAEREIAKLEQMLESSVNEADEFDRTSHLGGPVGPPNPTILRLMRYQSEASRRYFKHIKPLEAALKARLGTPKNSVSRPKPPVPVAVPASRANLQDDELAPIMLMRLKLADAWKKSRRDDADETAREIYRKLRGHHDRLVKAFLDSKASKGITVDLALVAYLNNVAAELERQT